MCSPPARKPARSWLSRRSTMATSTRANANSPANISPVGPPPAITTACSAAYSVIGTSVDSDLDQRGWPRPARLRGAPGLAASPLVGYKLVVGRRRYSPLQLEAALGEPRSPFVTSHLLPVTSHFLPVASHSPPPTLHSLPPTRRDRPVSSRSPPFTSRERWGTSRSPAETPPDERGTGRKDFVKPCTSQGTQRSFWGMPREGGGTARSPFVASRSPRGMPLNARGTGRSRAPKLIATPSRRAEPSPANQEQGLTRRSVRLYSMHIVDDLSRGFLAKRSPGVEGAGDVYGSQDSAVAPGVETASRDSLGDSLETARAL